MEEGGEFFPASEMQPLLSILRSHIHPQTQTYRQMYLHDTAGEKNLLEAVGSPQMCQGGLERLEVGVLALVCVCVCVCVCACMFVRVYRETIKYLPLA